MNSPKSAVSPLMLPTVAKGGFCDLVATKGAVSVQEELKRERFEILWNSLTKIWLLTVSWPT
jgi:hypothetical protein